MCCSELSTDMRVTDTNARHFVQHTQQLTSSLPRNTPLVPRLTSVALDQLFLPMVPAQVLGQLTALTVYNLWDLAALTNDTLAHTPALRSLTLHESEPQSDRDAPEPGVQLAPGEPDVPFKEPVYGGSDDTFTALMPRSGARDALRHLAAFKYVAYADVLPPALTAHLGAFLAARRGLRRVDIKAVVLDREGVRAVLRALRALPGLAVLGLEFRARRDAVGAGLDVLGRVPRTVTHLKFSVLGWDLAERATTAETVVKHAVRPAMHACMTSSTDIFITLAARVPPAPRVPAPLRRHPPRVDGRLRPAALAAVRVRLGPPPVPRARVPLDGRLPRPARRGGRRVMAAPAGDVVLGGGARETERGRGVADAVQSRLRGVVHLSEDFLKRRAREVGLSTEEGRFVRFKLYCVWSVISLAC